MPYRSLMWASDFEFLNARKKVERKIQKRHF